MKIFKCFISNDFGKIEISRYYAYLYEFQRQCAHNIDSESIVWLIMLRFLIQLTILKIQLSEIADYLAFKKLGLLGRKFSNVFFSDVLGKIEIFRYYAYL